MLIKYAYKFLAKEEMICFFKRRKMEISVIEFRYAWIVNRLTIITEGQAAGPLHT